MAQRLVRLQPPFFVACILALALNWISFLAPGPSSTTLAPAYLIGAVHSGVSGQFSVTQPQALLSLLSGNLYLTGLMGGSWNLVVA